MATSRRRQGVTAATTLWLVAIGHAWRPGVLFQESSWRRGASRVGASREGATSLLYGDLEPVPGGSYVLEPASAPKAVVHFIGGAFVGAASQLTYRYVLERLAKSGYLVVATPYRLSFDYVSVCDAIEASFQEAMREREAPGEVIGVGHSCGALLHALLASRDERRSRLALVSYNNKGATQAVPLFEEVVVPLATEAMRDDDATPAPLVREAIEAARGAASAAIDLADSLRPGPAPLATLADLARREVVPIARQSLELADQLPDLLREVADGARDFEPKPSDVRRILRTQLRARDALVVQFETDAIDESDDLLALLRDNAAARDDPFRLAKTALPGTHLTPLTQDIFLPASTVATLAQATDLADPALRLFRDRWLGQVDLFYDKLDAWLLDDPAPPLAPQPDPEPEVTPDPEQPEVQPDAAP